MAKYRVEGEALRKAMSLASKVEMNFAFSPAKTDQDHYLAMDKLKSPTILAKEAKEEGEGIKVCTGTINVVGKKLRLNVSNPLPGMEKKLKRHLKYHKVILDIEVLGANEDTSEPENNAQNDADESPAASLSQVDAEAQDGNVNPAERKVIETLQKRMSTQESEISKLPDNIKLVLRKHMGKAADALQEGNLKSARSITNHIDQILAKAAEKSQG